MPYQSLHTQGKLKDTYLVLSLSLHLYALIPTSLSLYRQESSCGEVADYLHIRILHSPWALHVLESLMYHHS